MQKGIQSKRTQKGEEKMTVFDELKARGLLAQLTDEEEIKELINNGRLPSTLVLILLQTVFT